MTKTKPIKIEAAALTDMMRIEVRVANATANRLVRRYHMCVKCAVEAALAYVKWERPENKHKLLDVKLCSDTCCEAFGEFLDALGHKRGAGVDPPPTAH